MGQGRKFPPDGHGPVILLQKTDDPTADVRMGYAFEIRNAVLEMQKSGKLAYIPEVALKRVV